MVKCKFCNSKKVIKYGKRQNKYIIKQCYLCNKCNRKFVEKDDLISRQFPPNIVEEALAMHHDGVSLRGIKKLLEWLHKDITISHCTILQWIRSSKENNSLQSKIGRLLIKRLKK